MTLSFSTQWPNKMGDLAGQPNYFIEKIWTGFPCALEPFKYFDYYANRDEYFDRFGKFWDGAWTDTTESNFSPKLHTLRFGTRWRQGMKIHPVINNRTQDRFQFADVFDVKSVQTVEIIRNHYPFNDVKDPEWTIHEIRIDKRAILPNEVTKLALNDGFPSVESFFRWFNEDGTYQLIHWTDLKY